MSAETLSAATSEPLTDLQAAMRGLMLTMADMDWPLGWAIAMRQIVDVSSVWTDVVPNDRSEALKFFEACAEVFDALASIPDEAEVV